MSVVLFYFILLLKMNDMRMHSRSKEQYKLKLENFWFNRYLASEFNTLI